MWKNSKVIFVTGKGGVGKSIVAAALAQSLEGKKVLLVETDTYSVFDGEAINPDSIRVIQRDKISSTNLTARACVLETFTRFLPSKRIVKAVVDNRITRTFIESAPSVNEFVILDQIFEFVQSKDWDTVVVDLPASGHALTFLTVPQTLAKMMRSRGPIGKAAEKINHLIMDKKTTSIIAVCLPEEMPVNETIELHHSLEETLGRALDFVVLNMVNEEPVESKDLAALREVDLSKFKNETMYKLIEANQIAADWAHRDASYVEELAQRLDVPQHHVPVFYEESDVDLCRRIAETLT